MNMTLLCVICGNPGATYVPVATGRYTPVNYANVSDLPEYDAVFLCRNPACRAELTARVRDGRYFAEHAKDKEEAPK